MARGEASACTNSPDFWDDLRWEATKTVAIHCNGFTVRRTSFKAILDVVDQIIMSPEMSNTPSERRPWLLAQICDNAIRELRDMER